MNEGLLRASVKLFLVFLFSLLPAHAWSASAASGSAFGIHSILSAVPVLGLPINSTLGPTPAGVSASAPPDFNVSATDDNTSQSVFGSAVVSSGRLTASTQSMLLANTVMSTADV